jgi:hypothetical protein
VLNGLGVPAQKDVHTWLSNQGMQLDKKAVASNDFIGQAPASSGPGNRSWNSFYGERAVWIAHPPLGNYADYFGDQRTMTAK